MDPEPGDGRLDETRPFKALSPGTMISHYRIMKKIGEGGMGVVYEAEDTKLRRHVALKFLPPDLTRDPVAKQRFMYEAQAASALEHSNICNIHEIDETQDGQLFISMACYEGETVRKKIERGPLQLEEAIDIALQVAGGLNEAHRKDIVHRDVKPANIIVTPQGQVKIMDFGLAKLADRTRLTKTGTAMGTVAYMSPEQAHGEDVDHRSDIWSLGVVLYEMLTGRLPFKSEYEQAIVYSILNDEPERISEIRPEIPDDLGQIVTKALQKSPSERYQSSDALLADLQRLRAGDRVEISLPRRKPLPRRLLVIAASAVLLVTAVALWPRLTQWFSPARATATTLAVVDFDNIDGEEASHLAVGLAEGICVKLSKVTGIQVVSSDDIRRLRKDDLPAKEIALRLGAHYAVGGSLLKSGEKIRVTPQLIEAATGNVVWTELFDREFDDVFAFMDEVSLKIVDALKIRFTQEDRLALSEKPTDSPEAYDHYLKGRHHFHRETVADNELATKEFHKALQIDPDYPLALAGLADAYVQRYRERYDYDEYWLDQADSLINRALGFESNLAEAYKSHAAVLLEKEHLLAALEAAKKARDLRPDWDEPYVQLGVIYKARGEASVALKMYERALAIRPSVRAWCGKGDILYMRGQVDSALMAYRAALEHNPHNADPYLPLGWHYWNVGRPAEADSMFRAAIRVRPDHVRSYREFSWLPGRVQEAHDLLRGFIDRYPYNWDAYERLYQIVAWDIGDYPGAMAVVEAAVARNPDRVWPHLLLALSHARQMSESASPENALAALEKALTLRPRSSRVLQWAGKIYAALGDMETALEYYRRALELNPGSASILNEMAYGLLTAGCYEDAASCALRAMEQVPGLAVKYDLIPLDNYRVLDHALPHLNRTDEYFEIVKTAAGKYGQNNPLFYLYLGREQCQRGEFQEAISSYKAALKIMEDSLVLLELGAAQWLSGDTDGALSSFLRAKEIANERIDTRLISLLKYLGRFDDIEGHLEAARAAGNIDRWGSRAVRYYASMRRFDDAIALGTEMYESAEVMFKDDLLLDMARWHRQKGDLEKALALLEKCEAALPIAYDPNLDNEHAVIASVQGRLDEAEEFARQAVEGFFGGYSWGAYLAFLGRLQYASGRMDDALNTLVAVEKGHRIEVMFPALYFRAQLKMVSQSPDAEDQLRKVLFFATRTARRVYRGGIDLAEARCYCALASARLGVEKRAREEITYALQLDPERADIAYFVAAAYSLIGGSDQALHWLQTAAERGHQELWWARVDPDLDPLRDLPRFNQIMADWDTRIRSLR
jgi:tetratricopeptide (TPR) repeat protein